MANENQKTVNEPSDKKKGNITKIIVGIIIIATIIGVGIWWFIKQSEFVTTDDAYVDAYEVTVSSQIPGRIMKLYIHEGDHVKKGQLVAQLDSSTYIAEIEQAKVSLEDAQIGIEMAKVKLSQAKINFDRAQEQYKAKLIPKANYQNIEKDYQLAQVAVKVAQSKIPTIKASLNTLQTALSHTNIYAPMDGVAAKRWVLAGDVVSPGQSMFTVFGTQKIWVTTMVPENELRFIHMGDTADITVDAFPDATFKGIFYQVGNSTASKFSLIPPDNASGNFTKVTQRVPLKLTIFKTGGTPKGNVDLLPGMSVELKVRIKKSK
ncbi:MAG: HlyD family secretion protein [Bacteroidales bacterium]|nr:HlyD family secretion protein [Bacteroidales bacterium]